jgi:methylenetetrahydrofolate reductase (NADPH)
MRSHVPGVMIPDESSAPERRAACPSGEGKRICIEIIQQVREIAGVSGVHVMAYRQEELVAEIIEEAGLLPRRFISELRQTNPCEEYVI